MNKIFCLCCAASLLGILSCNRTHVAAMHAETSEADNIKAKSPMIYKAIETGNTVGLDTLFAENFVEHNGPGGTEMKGKDSLMSMFRQMHTQFKDLKFKILANAYDNGYLMTMVHVTATTAQPAMGLPANYKIDNNSLDVVRFENGKAVEHWEYDQPKDIMKMEEMSKQMNKPDKSKNK